MRSLAIIFLLILFSLASFAQKPSTAKNTKPKSAPVKNVGDEKQEFDDAVNQPVATDRIRALKKFIEDFPESEDKARAQELIVSARAQLGEEKLQLGENEKGVEYFKVAAKDAPKPLSDRLFTEVVLIFPSNLFWRGHRPAALEIARIIEEKAEGNAKQLLALATFYLQIENAAETKRLAEKAIALEPNLPSGYQMLGLAHRLNFQLEEAANAYAKALEMDADSATSKRSLAEMKRALGKSDEAIALYREVLAKEATDAAAHAGLVLSLFNAEKQAEAEAEMQKSLEANPGNLPLLVGAAYWYAAHGKGDKAVELAQKALEVEPRYSWAYIALARGQMAQKRPLEAEKTLLAARQYGNFPTLDYEIASARMQAGFFREAAEELQKRFVVKDDLVSTNLGGRIAKEAKSFVELLALERRASIFEPVAADHPETAQKLKSLLSFSQKLNAKEIDETALSEAADEFISGSDKMKIHRQLFVANSLLNKKTALPKVSEITRNSVSYVDSALDVPNPSAAVMADELYESRRIALLRNEVILVPEIPRQTLSAILRGRIEEIAGWSLYQQNKSEESVVRFKRALSILPEKSAWARSSQWRLGAALEAEGKQKEALEAYIKSYTDGEQDAAKYLIIESLYEKINGSREGLEEKIGAKPASFADVLASQPQQNETVAQVTEKNITQKTENTELASTPEVESKATPEISLSPITEIKLSPTAEKTPIPPPEITATPEVKAEEIPETQVEENPETKAETTPEPSPSPETASTPEVSLVSKTSATRNPRIKSPPQVIVTSTIEPASSPTPDNSLKEAAEPTPETTTENNQPAAETKPSPIPETTPEVKPSPSPTDQLTETENKPETEIEPEPKPTPEVQATPETESEDAPKEDAPKTETKPVKTLQVIQTDTLAKADTEAKTPPKILFEPVIINVPKRENTKPAKTEEKPIEEETTEIPKPESTVAAERPRYVIETKNTLVEPCKILVSQESVSLLNDGGSLGILVATEGGGDVRKVTALSNSPQDVSIVLEPEIGAASGRAFYIVKSVSPKKGVYTISFELPCSKREILVKVR